MTRWLLGILIFSVANDARAEGYTKMGEAYLVLGIFFSLVLSTIVLLFAAIHRFAVKKKPITFLPFIAILVLLLSFFLNVQSNFELSNINYPIYTFSILSAIASALAIVLNYTFTGKDS